MSFRGENQQWNVKIAVLGNIRIFEIINTICSAFKEDQIELIILRYVFNEKQLLLHKKSLQPWVLQY